MDTTDPAPSRDSVGPAGKARPLTPQPADAPAPGGPATPPGATPELQPPAGGIDAARLVDELEARYLEMLRRLVRDDALKAAQR